MEEVCLKKHKLKRKILMLFAVVGVMTCISIYLFTLERFIPDTINLNSNSVSKINLQVPFLGTVSKLEDTPPVENISDERKTVSTNIKDNHIRLINYVEVKSEEAGKFKLEFNLLGFIKFKKVNVNVCDEKLVIPCGIPVGIYIKTEGVMVVDIGDVYVNDTVCNSPASDIIYPGDYIVNVAGKNVNTKEELIDEINNEQNYDNEYLNVGIRRNGELFYFKIKPVTDNSGKKKIGTWVRDDCQGLGTLTFIDKNGYFGALGHGISDVDTGKIVESESGRLYCAKVWSIIKGKSGAPGEVVGSINYDSRSYLGEISKNTDIGIYGKCDDNMYHFIDSYALPIAYKQDIKNGKAYIRSFIDGEITDYEININSINLSTVNINKGISFTVTDEELLKKTGGIVQGMSGSPIIQNGKVIGAITHVLVNDPTRGYGIFIETMLEY